MMMLWRRRVFGFVCMRPRGVKSISTFGEQRAKDKKGHSGAPFLLGKNFPKSFQS